MDSKEKIQGLRQLKQNATDKQDFLKSASDHGLIVSFGEGRRLWEQLDTKKSKGSDLR